MKTKPLVEAFMQHVDLDPSGCWLWTGGLNNKGYGGFTHRPSGIKTSAHRAAYQIFSGAVPDGCDVDHTCRVRHCVNPAHLEAITHQENCRRSVLTDAGRQRKQAGARKGGRTRGDQITAAAMQRRG